MKVETDNNGKELALVIPTKGEFDAWVDKHEFTSLNNLMDGYAVVHANHDRVRDDAVEDPEGLISDAINTAENEIEDAIFNLFVCAFRGFAAHQEGGAK